MEVRRRKTKPQAVPNGDRRGSSNDTRGAKIDKGFTRAIWIVVAIVVSFTSAVFICPDQIPNGIKSQLESALNAMGLEQKVHAVVFDAGSTGTRLLAFSFHRSFIDGQLHLDDELWLQVKPGLSSYADNPAEAAKSVEGLLEKAREGIPKASWASTPVTLKATAGLRLLPKDKSEAIINSVETVLRDSGFKPEEPLIEIMSPLDEGLFGWFTLNFLTDRLNEDLGSSFVTLDLGGGSTQITFSPRVPLNMMGRRHFLHNVRIMKQEQEVYSHSYLGLGLMSAREAVFKHGSSDPNALELSSPCISSKTPLEFKFQGKTYKVSADQNPSFENCIKIVNKVVNQENVHMPPELPKRQIAAFSYFFDKALERNLIPKATEGFVQVSTFLHEAHKACEPSTAGPNSEFACVDLAFISSLLTKGYGLPAEKEIYLFKKILGHEISWAMGLAYQILERP